MESIFSQIYKYRQTEHKNQLENYLTEIFAYCLKEDEVFRNAFFERIQFQERNRVKIFTQRKFDNKIPDIAIIGKEEIFFVECKVGADEGINQLNNYKHILNNQSYKKTGLIYLTKYVSTKKVGITNITWTDIAKLKANNELTIQLKKYLKDNNISMTDKFTANNIISLKNFRETLQKMDYVLESIKKEYKTKFEYKKNEKRLKKLLEYNAYFDKIKYSEKITLDIGFFGFDVDITVGVRFYIPIELEVEKNMIKQRFNNNEWIELYDVWVGKYKRIEDNLSIERTTMFLKEILDEILKFEEFKDKEI